MARNRVVDKFSKCEPWFVTIVAKGEKNIEAGTDVDRLDFGLPREPNHGAPGLVRRSRCYGGGRQTDIYSEVGRPLEGADCDQPRGSNVYGVPQLLEAGRTR